MLVLSRNVGQQIVVAENIDITILEIRGNLVRLGIIAPREVSVHRVNRHRPATDHENAVISPQNLRAVERR